MIKRRFDSVLYEERFKELLKKYHVKRIAVFGSYAYGRPTGKSDIDFLVEFKKETSLLDMVGLKLDLQELLHKDVDIATPKSLSKYIRGRVLKQAVYLHE
jgi:predicted nucleotidyltransferase